MSVREMIAGKTRYVFSMQELQKQGIDARCSTHVFVKGQVTRESIIGHLKAQCKQVNRR